MKKIIHLSDLHIGYDDHSERLENIRRSICLEKQPAANYIILITGDIVEKATDESNFKEASLFINRMEAEGYTVLPVPGNHDYGTGRWADKVYVDVFKEYFFSNASEKYPKVDIVEDDDGTSIAFLGLDSMANELHWYDRGAAQGDLGEAQLIALKEALAREKVQSSSFRVVYLHHHPFDRLPFHSLKDSDKLRDILKGSPCTVDAILYGHNHVGKVHNGVWGIPRCYDAGSSTKKKGCRGPHRVIDLSRDPCFDYDGDFLD